PASSPGKPYESVPTPVSPNLVGVLEVDFFAQSPESAITGFFRIWKKLPAFDTKILPFVVSK
ncbi:MAG: hypothetical protein V3W43_03670, partial [Desulfatiglandaceae bacterium]